MGWGALPAVAAVAAVAPGLACLATLFRRVSLLAHLASASLRAADALQPWQDV
jgi:hypothetical protein